MINRNHSVCSLVGRLAPQIGDYDVNIAFMLLSFWVGRLAPQIGDYDSNTG